jgi:hypothetical protein
MLTEASVARRWARSWWLAARASAVRRLSSSDAVCACAAATLSSARRFSSARQASRNSSPERSPDKRCTFNTE